MNKYIQYLKYLFSHKYYVAKVCFENGLYYQGIVHDFSKFLPSEFFPYADFFADKKKRDSTGYYKPTDTGNKAFDFAWLLHQKRNRHHWQFWVLPEDAGGTKILEMPEKYMLEMICDWIGAGKAQGFHSPKENLYLETQKWYTQNKSKMNLHPQTRIDIELTLFGVGQVVEWKAEDDENWDRAVKKIMKPHLCQDCHGTGSIRGQGFGNGEGDCPKCNGTGARHD